MSEKRCDLPAMFRYTWPGRDENYICLAHALQMQKIASAMGLHIQFIPLDFDEVNERTCSQVVKEREE